jgi:CheY-like chemotaxis protein
MANILIVEDNESLRLAYSSFLEQEGHVIATASRVKEALEYLATHTPDLILLDMLMPEMNGLELLQQYDLLETHKGVKVIGFSNLTEARIEQEARSLGVNLYLTKSLTTPRELIDTVNGLLEK